MQSIVSEREGDGKPFRISVPMQVALAHAEVAFSLGEVPVGCVVTTADGQIISEAHNETLLAKDITSHAEILALRRASFKLGSERLANCDLYVTLEPCTMCAAAISFSRIRRLYFAASDIKGGAVENGVRFFSAASCCHAPDVYGGIGESESSVLLRRFFAQRR